MFILRCSNCDDPSGHTRDTWPDKPTKEELVSSLLAYYDKDEITPIVEDLLSWGGADVRDSADSTHYDLEEV